MPLSGPRNDLRPGSQGSQLARLVIVGLLTGVQYWLLTATVEAWHGGSRVVPVVATIASFVCFALAAGLVIVGEKGDANIRRDVDEP
jgi:hypothetical protein